MSKKSLIVLLILVSVLSISVNVNAVSEEALYFAEEWNKTVDNLAEEWTNKSDRNENLADQLYLSEETLDNSFDSSNKYVINFFDNSNVAIELTIDYREDTEKFFIDVLNMQSDRQLFLETNYETAHIGEVLIHTIEDYNEASKIVKQLRIFDFWSYDDLENINAYNILESDQDGVFHFNSYNDFNLNFDVFQGSFPNGFDISYFGSWRR